ncbi:MAG: putative Polysaccharide export protein [Deltaproteobacteria bacterium]|nr:putative Polysaccharide export protein [Deltaproteobacteria bacterium]
MQKIESARQIKAMNKNIFAAMGSSPKPSDRDYKIGPEDLLEISVFEDEKLNKTVRVSSQGNISLPLLGVLRVKGLTANELEREIRDLLAEKYLHDPHVGVFIKEYRNQRISVIGMVEKPGVYDVTGQKMVLDMLTLAGGLKEDAGPLLFLIRSSLLQEGGPGRQEESSGQAPQTLVIRLEELLIRGDLATNVAVIHGDVINIPPSGKVFVGGAVVKPGGFSLKGKKLTVSQAITLAEGLKPESSGSEARIYRYSGIASEKEAIPIDVLAIQDGLAEDPYLEENDILIVPQSPVKYFLIGLRDSLKGFFSFGFWVNP